MRLRDVTGCDDENVSGCFPQDKRGLISNPVRYTSYSKLAQYPDVCSSLAKGAVKWGIEGKRSRL